MEKRKQMLEFRIVGRGYIQRDDHDRLKLGFSLDPLIRLKQCQTGNADKLQLVAVIPGITQADERRLHGALRQYRVAPRDQQRREWYFNRKEFWVIVRRFVKDQRTSMVVIEPDQPDLPWGDAA